MIKLLLGVRSGGALFPVLPSCFLVVSGYRINIALLFFSQKGLEEKGGVISGSVATLGSSPVSVSKMPCSELGASFLSGPPGCKSEQHRGRNWPHGQRTGPVSWVGGSLRAAGLCEESALSQCCPSAAWCLFLSRSHRCLPRSSPVLSGGTTLSPQGRFSDGTLKKDHFGAQKNAW